MNLLLDTHAFLWFIGGSSSLSKRARTLIEDETNRVVLSTASLWEIAIKISLEKLTLSESFDVLIPEQLAVNGIELLDISINHAALVANLPFHHRDPFDRLLVAQAKVEQMAVISKDQAFDAYEVNRLW
ncbi:MAG: type II toxin-antitoxin system VapC family toxin [Chloroflexi bacterium]|nr:type II toxin-antitoxin system VapC family toxin [Chloroflexota bacterium]